jgi:hypothetical protein
MQARIGAQSMCDGFSSLRSWVTVKPRFARTRKKPRNRFRAVRIKRAWPPLHLSSQPRASRPLLRDSTLKCDGVFADWRYSDGDEESLPT